MKLQELMEVELAKDDDADMAEEEEEDDEHGDE